MTKEELKKKIKEVLRKRMTELLGSCQTDEISLDEEGKEAVLFYADEFADALIAAGIGDVKRHRVFVSKDGKEVKQFYSGEEVENIVKERNELKVELRDKVDYIHEQDEVIKEYKHRAARAEMALKRFSENIVCEDCPFFQECTLSSKLKAVSYSQKCFGEYLRQAEKELAEEGKDD